MRDYHEAIENLRVPDNDRFRSLVVEYRGSAQYKALSEVTKRKRGPWLDRVADYFGDLRIAQFERPEKIRPIIIRWRKQWADKPRTVRFCDRGLSCVLSYAVDPLGRLATTVPVHKNVCIAPTEARLFLAHADIGALKRTCSIEIARAADLAFTHGLEAR